MKSVIIIDRVLCLLAFSLLFSGLKSQTSVLTIDEFLAQLRQNHPISQSAALLSREAAAARLSAGGAFDPELYTDYEDKFFKKSDYWDIGEGGLRIPTIGGLEFGAGYRWATGSFLNPQNFQSPTRGQSFVGLKANLLQGLFTDERRTQLSRAELLGDWNQVEVRAIQNDLAYDALKSYVEWSLATAFYTIVEESIELAELRLEQTIQSYEAGDKPALDTLETQLQLRQRRVDLLAAERDLIATRQMLNTFIWSGDNPAVLSPNTVPLLPEVVVGTLPQPTNFSIRNNPALLIYDFKLRDLNLEARLKRQKLLPKLSLKYEALADGFDFTPSNEADLGISDFVLQDNKWGISFSMPLMFRSARADVQLNTIKQERTQLERNQKGGELELKQAQFTEQVRQIGDQLTIYRQIVSDYQSLLEAERTKFRFGESSVFLLNTRENKLLDAQLKLVKLESELAKAVIGQAYIAGELINW